MKEQSSVKNETGSGLWKTFQIWGLALAVPFEMASGPFIGYFIGLYLKHRLGMHDSFIYLLVLLGLVAGFVNTAVIIRMMIKLNEK
ncbi:MAG: AtpZ/AtpI family protein [Candidatus Paceibacterota bacterium]|jgi:F0F1-type ATP synthase assembly protein I|nr:AtpZ/AtpI family protein [Candidatus Omnitrophota bacterium]